MAVQDLAKLQEQFSAVDEKSVSLKLLNQNKTYGNR